LSGRLEIDYINEKFPELNLPEDDFQTLSGYVVMTSETLPQPGEVVALENYRFIVEKMDDTRIEVLRLMINEEDADNEENN